MKLECYQLTSAGDREVNQDAMAHSITDDYGLFIVADGLGGHQAGEKASQFLCQGMLKWAAKYSPQIRQRPQAVFSTWVDAAIGEMTRLFAADSAASEAHTTCAILYVDAKVVLTAHCGDSRIYRMNPEEILWRTKDHSVPQQLLDKGEIQEHEIGSHPEQNRLTRSINVLKRYPAEINRYPPPVPGETFILCSDGFWEHVKLSEFLELAQLSSGKAELVKKARLSVLRAGGGSDNVTVQWVRCL
ncbi:MAG: serine/threonine-protein phosphatase [Gammaproteobacteria bacterium HGW-Gammaproteobacteria-3]|nr:MAG: serine/threonine-protein phosphatase [Gammaproteobacteria bacterium HGW-Gammaproteobacteria-3]